MEDQKQRELKSILEKLNSLNIEQVSEQIKNASIDNAVILAGLVSQIYDEALKKPGLYESLCFQLAQTAGLPEFSNEDDEKISFRSLLANKCQVEFDRMKRELDEANRAFEGVDEKKSFKKRNGVETERKEEEQKVDNDPQAQILAYVSKKRKKEEELQEARSRMMGNVQLIGELFRNKLLPEKLMRHCVKEFLGEKDQGLGDEDLDALCILVGVFEKKRRQLKVILQELNPQNIEQVFEKIKKVDIYSTITLRDLVSLIYYEALTKPALYANLCSLLAAKLPDFGKENERRITFKRLLVNKCQEEFERGESEQSEANRVEEGEIKGSEEEREEKNVQALKRMLGKIQLMAELFKRKVFPPRLMHECIKNLLGQFQNPDEEDVEALWKLMCTVGEMIDDPKAEYSEYKEFMDEYFEIMLKLSNNEKLSSRVRSMLRDAIELREKQRQKANRDALQVVRISFGGRGQTTGSDAIGWNSVVYYPRTQQGQGQGQGRGFPGLQQPQVRSETESQAKVRESLRKMSIEAITKFYSTRSAEEMILCIKEFNSPDFYPEMVSHWVIDSFERKEVERVLLAKLLIYLSKSQEILLSQEQLITGFILVLSSLENAIIDVPKSTDYLGCILAKIILEKVVSLRKVGRLMFRDFDDQDQVQLIQTGLALEILGTILEIIRTKKRDPHPMLNEIRVSSNQQLEDYQPVFIRKPRRCCVII